MLAWSVHAADDETRKLLVPTTKHSMVELREAFRDALRSRPSRALRTLMVEVALMDGLNDSPAHAERLAEFLRPMIEEDKLKLCVNLIPYNPVEHQPLYRRPAAGAVEAFQQILRARGVTFVRTTHGDEVRFAPATKRKPLQSQPTPPVVTALLLEYLKKRAEEGRRTTSRLPSGRWPCRRSTVSR